MMGITMSCKGEKGTKVNCDWGSCKHNEGGECQKIEIKLFDTRDALICDNYEL